MVLGKQIKLRSGDFAPDVLRIAFHLNIEHEQALLAEKKLVYVINEYINGQAK